MPGRFEVHQHAFISGPRARFAGRPEAHLVHAHFGGDVAHSHPETGPASYTIDKDEWFRATGLKGGGRKKFTEEPSGEQLPVIPRTAEESRFEVIVCDPPPGHEGQEGGGLAAAARMVLAFGLTAIVKDGRGPRGRRAP